MKLTVHPLTPARWPDLEALFATKGCSVPRQCWCMYYRRSGARGVPPTGTTHAQANRAELKALVDAGAAGVRARLLAANFTAWAGRIERCLVESGDRLPPGVDRRALALFVLTTMEGGVMLARTYRDVAMFDAAVAQLREVFARLLRDPGAARRRQPRR